MLHLMPWLLLVVSPVAGAASPAFTLDELAVTLTLPEGAWRLREWSADTLEVQLAHPQGKIDLSAWSTPIRVGIDPAAAWRPVHEGRIREDGVIPHFIESAVSVVANRRVASLRIDLPETSEVRLAATMELDAANLHLAFQGRESLLAVLETLRATVIQGSTLPEGHALPEPRIETAHLEATLPIGWRPPLTEELPHLAMSELGDCASAILPSAGAAPLQIVVCDQPMRLGVVDAYAFDRLEPVVRATLAPEAGPAERVDLDDRTAFLFGRDSGPVVGVVPHDGGVTSIEGFGASAAVVEASMRAARWSGPHPASLVDQAWYWLTVRTLSWPMLLVYGLAFLATLGLVRARTRTLPTDDAP